MSADTAVTPQAVAVGVGVLVVGVMLYRAAKAAPQIAAGLVSGHNAITENQTNADGDKTTAYEGAGLLGTLGGIANSASGGWFATAGQNIGGWVYDATHKPDDNYTGTW